MPRSVPPLETKTDGAGHRYITCRPYRPLQKLQSWKSLVGCWFVTRATAAQMNYSLASNSKLPSEDLQNPPLLHS